MSVTYFLAEWTHFKKNHFSKTLQYWCRLYVFVTCIKTQVKQVITVTISSIFCFTFSIITVLFKIHRFISN